MTATHPIAEPFLAGTVATPWSEATRRLAGADTYWLATVRADGGPHAMPVLAVWVDDALHFVASGSTRKATNLARDPRCVVCTGSDGADLVVEGEAGKVTAESALGALADAYRSKYGWSVEVRNGALWGDGAPTAGPPPYLAYRVNATTSHSHPPDGAFATEGTRLQ